MDVNMNEDVNANEQIKEIISETATHTEIIKEEQVYGNDCPLGGCE